MILTHFAPYQKRVHVAMNFATGAHSFEKICTPVRCFRKRDTRFFPEGEIPAFISYDAEIPTAIRYKSSQTQTRNHYPIFSLPTSSPRMEASGVNSSEKIFSLSLMRMY